MNTKIKTYHIETMGCQMNERDSETVAGMLESRGYARVMPDDSADVKAARMEADIVVVNTCSVRENADNRFFGALGQIKHAKTADPDKIVAVCGCMMQQEHVVARIREVFPWVDIVFGTHNIDAFPRLLEETEAERTQRRQRHFEVLCEGGEIAEGLPTKRRHRHRAYVSIMQGCNNFCTYCIVPYTRGRERCRTPEAILSEVRALAEDDVKEITLLGQNVNSWHGGQLGFSGLIRLLDTVSGIERIRFMTSHPKDLSDGLVSAFADTWSLCPHIHLPVQAGSSRVLARMNRGYTKEGYLALIEKLRAARPDIAVTTDFIVGFPGETEEDFEDTMDVIERVRYDAAFTFIFSPRTGTPAASYADRIPEEIVHERFDRMVARLNAIALEKNLIRVGGTEPVLVDGVSKTDETMLSGRTPDNKLVNFKDSHGQAAPGSSVFVRIESANTFSFLGTACRNPSRHGDCASGSAGADMPGGASSASPPFPV
ncbi:MAG: tRNA (N6-isopentenyl adenosine(37)-C2)-methylthiotransferase MiaB [Clostridiales Family XIII bacterium]|jgi:tRNA-2-methylthio-N6-dimethylallyladenosine synthase|nr:tRNA (N6-isopentenyl adenosine(37)-C2)-methylthiotransferase MiaB [Clostridiales Family XIII bacterium]